MTNRLPSTTPMPCSPSYAQRVSARMTLDEAIKGISRMMLAYPTFRCSQEVQLTLAEVLLCYPREVATAACSPVHGVPKAIKDFPPNAGQITDWCEREATWLYRMAGMVRRDQADAKQINDRNEFFSGRQERTSGGSTHSALCARYGLRDIPSGIDAVDLARLAHKHGSGLAAYLDSLGAKPSIEVARARAAAIIDRAGGMSEELMLMEYRRQGREPVRSGGILVSPWLEARVKEGASY